jgi:hypothetical protein
MSIFVNCDIFTDIRILANRNVFINNAVRTHHTVITDLSIG